MRDMSFRTETLNHFEISVRMYLIAPSYHYDERMACAMLGHPPTNEAQMNTFLRILLFAAIAAINISVGYRAGYNDALRDQAQVSAQTKGNGARQQNGVYDPTNKTLTFYGIELAPGVITSSSEYHDASTSANGYRFRYNEQAKQYVEVPDTTPMHIVTK